MKAKIELSIILLVFFTKMVDAQDTPLRRDRSKSQDLQTDRKA